MALSVKELNLEQGMPTVDAAMGWLEAELAAVRAEYDALKAKGLQHTEGKEYVVQDGDIIEFLFNV